MKQVFNKNWNSSVQPRKQRKYAHNAPLHVKSAMLHATLSKDLREKHARRSLRVRKGDEVEVLRGQFKGEKGIVESVDVKKCKIIVRGVDMIKLDGSKRPYPVAVSNTRITKLVEDKRRL